MSGNVSLSNRVCLQQKRSFNKVKLQATVNKKDKYIQLTWDESIGEIDRVVIYKMDEKGKLRLYTTINGGEVFYNDKRVAINQEYRYRIKVCFNENKIQYSNTIIAAF